MFRHVSGSFAICRLPADSSIPDWVGQGVFNSVTRTSEELSIVCLMDQVPQRYRPEVPWFCLKLEGPFPFSEVGVLASFIGPLAEHQIPVFAVATYDTDYVLIQENYREKATSVLRDAGHKLLSN
jgi:hypothetical protein